MMMKFVFNSINEMAQVNTLKDKYLRKYKIEVHGGGKCGASEHGEPHFVLNLNNKLFEYFIPYPDDMKNNILKHCKGFELNHKEIKELKLWLSEISNKDNNFNNVEYLREVWNRSNVNNPNLGANLVLFKPNEMLDSGIVKSLYDKEILIDKKILISFKKDDDNIPNFYYNDKKYYLIDIFPYDVRLNIQYNLGYIEDEFNILKNSI